MCIRDSITTAIHFIPDIRVVYWAYPLTWSISSVLFALFVGRLHLPSVTMTHPITPEKR